MARLARGIYIHESERVQNQAGNHSLPFMKSIERKGAISLSESCFAQRARLSGEDPGPWHLYSAWYKLLFSMSNIFTSVNYTTKTDPIKCINFRNIYIHQNKNPLKKITQIDFILLP